jgi:beta-glucanase (GH16 family)
MLLHRLFISLLSQVIIFNNVTAQSKPFAGGSEKFQHLVWSEEFNYNGLPDPNKWKFDTGYLRNHELQYYTDKRIENAAVKDGNLTITARNDSMKSGARILPVTSAGISTQGKADWTYGRFEVRAKIPSSLGTWPAIWMLGSDIDKAGWPACGEIDMMEHVGYMPDTLHFNVHTEKYNHVKKTNKGVKIPYKEPYKDFHVYAIEWFKDHIDWYLDDKKVFTFANEGSGNAAWPFDKPQFLILNLAFGGDWGGQRGVNLQSLPQALIIDYVRVYQ